MGNQSGLVDAVLTPIEGTYAHGRGGNTITKITVHCMVGQCEPEGCAGVFRDRYNRGDLVSCNYMVGPTGRVGIYVPEEDTSYCSLSEWNDQQAITIEVASDAEEPLAFKDEAYNKLVLLCADICNRYGFKLYYTGDKSGSLTGHWMFSSKTCPGTWFRERYYDFCNEVNALVDGGVFTPDDYDDSWQQGEEDAVYDYYLITSTDKQTQPGDCGNKITGSVYLGRW